MFSASRPPRAQCDGAAAVFVMWSAAGEQKAPQASSDGRSCVCVIVGDVKHIDFKGFLKLTVS